MSTTAVHGENSPFAINADTYDDAFCANFHYADMSLLGMSRGVEMAFVNATYEGGRGKYGYFDEMAPIMSRYTTDFQSRGDDANGDGVPDYGPGLPHEYNMPDLLGWLGEVRTAARAGRGGPVGRFGIPLDIARVSGPSARIRRCTKPAFAPRSLL